MTRQGLEPWCTPVHTGRCLEHTCIAQEALRCAMSIQSVWLRCRCVYQLITAETHAVGRHRPVDPVASCLFGCQGSEQSWRLKLRDSPHPFRESRATQPSSQLLPTHYTASGSVWGGSSDKGCLSLVVCWLKTVAAQWLSPMLICPIRCSDKPRQIASNRDGHSGLGRCRAGSSRLCAA